MSIIANLQNFFLKEDNRNPIIIGTGLLLMGLMYNWYLEYSFQKNEVFTVAQVKKVETGRGGYNKVKLEYAINGQKISKQTNEYLSSRYQGSQVLIKVLRNDLCGEARIIGVILKTDSLVHVPSSGWHTLPRNFKIHHF
jgi:hypothetical protein